jgi:hypothetical protein
MTELESRRPEPRYDSPAVKILGPIAALLAIVTTVWKAATDVSWWVVAAVFAALILGTAIFAVVRIGRQVGRNMEMAATAIKESVTVREELRDLQEALTATTSEAVESSVRASQQSHAAVAGIEERLNALSTTVATNAREAASLKEFSLALAAIAANIARARGWQVTVSRTGAGTRMTNGSSTIALSSTPSLAELIEALRRMAADTSQDVYMDQLSRAAECVQAVENRLDKVDDAILRERLFVTRAVLRARGWRAEGMNGNRPYVLRKGA